MKRGLFLTAISLTLMTVLNACCTIAPGKVVYSDKTLPLEKMDNVKAVILVTKDGQLLFYDDKGTNLEKCVLPKPVKKSEKFEPKKAIKKDAEHEQVPEGVCKGLTTGSAVTSIQTLPILKTNSQTCMTFGPDGSGFHYQICW